MGASHEEAIDHETINLPERAIRSEEIKVLERAKTLENIIISERANGPQTPLEGQCHSMVIE